jgi:transcriptional regulator with XRE-family HTH domain
VLRELREGKGFTQVELAEKANVERTYLTKLETGKKVNPSLAILRRLAKALGVSVPELLS